MDKWIKIWPHKWKHSRGFVIQRMWTLAGKRVYYFLCYWSEDDYHKGDNFASFMCLKEAKNSFKQ